MKTFITEFCKNNFFIKTQKKEDTCHCVTDHIPCWDGCGYSCAICGRIFKATDKFLT